MFALSEPERLQILIGVFLTVGALITAVVPVLIGRHFDRTTASMAEQNTVEHGINKEILEGLVVTVNHIDTRLDDHFSWHLHAQPNVVQIVRPQDVVEEGTA